MPKKRKRHALKDITNELEHKKPKPNEALQLLLQLHPDLNSQKIYFFPCMNVHEEGILLYDQKDNLYYVHDILSGKEILHFFFLDFILRDSKKLYKGNHSPLATIFLKPDPFSANISNILREKGQKYFKQKEILSVKEFQTQIQQRIHENSLYASVIIKEISGGVELMEIKYNDTIKRKLIIEWKDTIHIHKIVIEDSCHQPLAILENKDSSEECYQHINCKSIAHSSKQLLTKIILKQHNQKSVEIKQIQEKLKEYIEKEEAPISTKMSNLIENVSENVVNNQIDISNSNPILQKLIQIQCSNKEKMKYYPMFICWAISIYTRAG
nr:12418_t:CDS:2 [Entrophospora candida]